MSNEENNTVLNTKERSSTFGAYVLLFIVLFGIVVYRIGTTVLSEQNTQQSTENLKNNK